MRRFTRRSFVKSAVKSSGVAALCLYGCANRTGSEVKHRSDSDSIKKHGFYTVGQRGGHWWLIRPDGRPEFSIGMNHIDSATLRYEESGDIWRERFGNSQERWLREGVRKDLLDWGFNCIGWNQEVVIRGEFLTEGGVLHRHSPRFTFEEYQWADMPYCHMLPIMESHQWELESRLPDIRSKEFNEWCDYVARADCARMRDDPKLIGYFYTDCPIWIHARRPDYKPSIFDPELLETDAGRRELFEMATHYYRVTHDAIRRYDPNHLILGDRYEGRAPLAEEVVRAAVPFIDVLSFQNFGPIDEVIESFRHWHDVTGLPILLADAGEKNRGKQAYRLKIRTLRELPCCVGWHLCGAYLRNHVRQTGLRTEQMKPNRRKIDEITAANHETAAFVRETTTQ